MKRAVLGVVAVVLAGCEPVNLPVLALPDGGTDVTVGASCARSEDCMGGQFCEKESCGAVSGVCTQIPAVCGGQSAEAECGCDGVTYWNACLRQQAGVEAAREMGPCRQPMPCSATTACPTGALCFRFVRPNDCGRPAAGACWVLPDVACTGPLRTYSPCSNPGQCLDQCAAIRSGVVVSERPPGPCP